MDVGFLEVFGYVVLGVVALYIVPRLVSAGIFRSLLDFKRKLKGESDGKK